MIGLGSQHLTRSRKLLVEAGLVACLLLGAVFLLYFPSGTTTATQVFHASFAFLLALAPFATLWLWFGPALTAPAASGIRNGSNLDPRLRHAFLPVLAIAGAWTVYTGAQLDYADYLMHWQALLDGLDPWMQDRGESRNAYGPLHLLFAPMAYLHPLLAKVVAGLIVFLSAVLIGRQLVRDDRLLDPAILVLSLLTILSPFIWATVFHLGHNDIVTAFLVLLAFLCHMRERPTWVGVILGLAVLHKFYPILLLPFLVVSVDGIRIRTVAFCFLVVAAGLGVSFAIWGEDALGPLIYTQDRSPTLLSIFRVSAAYPSVGQRLFGIADMSVFSMPAMLAVGAVISLYVYLYRIPALLGAISGLLAMLLLYKVGYQQYYITYFLLLALATVHWRDRRYQMTILLSIPFVIFVTAFEVYFDLSFRAEPYPFIPAIVRHHIGIPAFLIGVPTVLAGLYVAGRQRREKLLQIGW